MALGDIGTALAKGAYGLGKNIFAPVSRSGTGLGSGMGIASTQSSFNKTQDNLQKTIEENQRKAAELIAAGRMDEAKRFLTLANKGIGSIQSQGKQRAGETSKAVEDIIKGGIGTASFFLPGGKTLKAKAALGALSGGMAGLGLSKKGGEIADTVTGAGIGAALPIASDKLGKLFNKTKKAPLFTGKKLDKSPAFASARRKLVETAEGIGIDGRMTGPEMTDKIGSAFEESAGRVSKILEEAEPIDVKVAAKIAKDMFENSNIDENSTVGKRLLTKINKEFAAAGDDPQKMYSLKTKARKYMGNYFSKQGTNPTPKQETWKLVYDTTKKILDQTSDEIRKENRFQKELYDLAEEVTPEAIKDLSEKALRVPWSNIAAPLGFNQETATRAFRTVGSIPGKIASIPKAITSSASNGAGGMMAPGLVSIMSQFSTPISERQGIGASPQQAMQASQTTGLGPTPEAAVQEKPKVVNPWGLSVDDLGQIYALAIASGDKQAISQAGALYEMELDNQKRMADQGGDIDATKTTAMGVVDELSGLYESVQGQGLTAQSPGLGRLQGVAGGISSFTQSSPEAAAYQDLKSGFMSSLSRGMGERGVLTDTDIKRAEKALPKFSDTPAVAAQKWASLTALLQEFASKDPTTVEEIVGLLQSSGAQQ